MLKPKELKKQFDKLDQITTFLKEEFKEEELSEDEQLARQQEELNKLMPLVEAIGENVFKRFQTSKAGLTRSMNANEKALNKAMFMDGMENHPQGQLIKLALDQGLIGKSTIDLIARNPLIADIALAKIAPLLDQLQDKLSSTSSTSSTKGISSNNNLI